MKYDKQAAATALFEQVEQGLLTVQAPDTVIADAVYVLSSPRLYHLARRAIQEMLAALVRLPQFHVQNRLSVLRALDLFAAAEAELWRCPDYCFDGATRLTNPLLLRH